MKVLITADLHIHHWKNFAPVPSQMRRDICLDQLEKIVSGHYTQADLVIILGDLYHKGSYLHTDTAFRVHNILQTAAMDKDIIIIPGNHDMAMPADNFPTPLLFHSVLPTNTLHEVFVPHQPTRIAELHPHNFILVPYHPVKEEMLEYLKKAVKLKDKKAGGTNVLLSHFGVAGSYPHDSINSYELHPEELPLDDFDLIILGHYHTSQTIHDKIYYVGSPLQHTWSEAGDDKTVLLIDTDTGELHPIRTEHASFLEFRAETREQVDRTVASFKNDWLRILAQSEEIADYCRSKQLPFAEVHIEREEQLRQRLNVAGYRDITSIIEAYVDYKGVADADTVKKAGKKLWMESQK